MFMWVYWGDSNVNSWKMLKNKTRTDIQYILFLRNSISMLRFERFLVVDNMIRHVMLFSRRRMRSFRFISVSSVSVSGYFRKCYFLNRYLCKGSGNLIRKCHGYIQSTKSNNWSSLHFITKQDTDAVIRTFPGWLSRDL